MPEQVSVLSAADRGEPLPPGDDSYQAVFDRNPTPMWLYDLGTHRFFGSHSRCGDTLGVLGSASTSAIIASSASGMNGFASVRIAPSICAMPR